MNFADIGALVFDSGGVVALPPPPDWALWDLIAEVGLSRTAWEAGFAKWRGAWDRDEISGEEMYARILDENGIAHTPGLVAEILHADAAGWGSRLNPDALALARRAKDAGVKVALLTNMSTQFYNDFYLKNLGAFHALADVEVVSGREHVSKPDPRIFQIMQARLALPPERILFLDDTPRNVEAARACGWRAELYGAK